MNKIKEICTEVFLNSLNSLIIEADKNNIERDVLMEHYSNIVSMVVSVSTFSDYKPNIKK